MEQQSRWPRVQTRWPGGSSSSLLTTAYNISVLIAADSNCDFILPLSSSLFSQSPSLGKIQWFEPAPLRVCRAASQTQLSTDWKHHSEKQSLYFKHISKMILRHSPRGGRRMLLEPWQCLNAWSWQYGVYTYSTNTHSLSACSVLNVAFSRSIQTTGILHISH